MADQSFLLLRHDVLDAQVVDVHDQRVGRADEVLLDFSAGAPRVAAIVIGGAARAQRMGAWARGMRRVAALLFRRDHDPVSRIPFDRVACLGDTVRINVHGDSLESAQLEVWLRDHVVMRIPGGSGDTK